jgi:polysaccharide deacetylase 2 family uncharacterized protein YibQ
VVLVILAVAAGLGLVLRPSQAPVRYVDIPVVVLPLPPPPAPPSAVAREEPARLTALAAPEPSNRDEQAGRDEQARPAPLDPCSTPCVAVAVTGLGLASETTARALALPPPVALSFSPYAADLANWAAKVAAAGHPRLLDLPLQPARYPEDDAGPLTLLTDAPLAALDELMTALLADAEGSLGVLAAAGAFAAEPKRFGPIAAALKARKLALFELAPAKLGEVAAKTPLTYATALAPAGEGGLAAIERALGTAEAEALRYGRAMVAVPPLPAALDRVAAWIPTLAGKGLTLVPPSAILSTDVATQEAARP